MRTTRWKCQPVSGSNRSIWSSTRPLAAGDTRQLSVTDAPGLISAELPPEMRTDVEVTSRSRSERPIATGAASHRSLHGHDVATATEATPELASTCRHARSGVGEHDQPERTGRLREPQPHFALPRDVEVVQVEDVHAARRQRAACARSRPELDTDADVVCAPRPRCAGDSAGVWQSVMRRPRRRSGRRRPAQV